MQNLMEISSRFSPHLLGSCLPITPRPFVCLSVCLSVPCLCCLLNLPAHHCAASVLFNWWRPTAAMASSLQQTCCVRLCMLSGRTAVILAIDQARHTHVNKTDVGLWLRFDALLDVITFVGRRWFEHSHTTSYSSMHRKAESFRCLTATFLANSRIW